MATEGSDRSERPTIRPAFEPEAYARQSERLVAAARPPDEVPPPRPELPTVPAFPVEELAPAPPLPPDERRVEPFSTFAADAQPTRASLHGRSRRAGLTALLLTTLLGAAGLFAHHASGVSSEPVAAAQAPPFLAATAEPPASVEALPVAGDRASFPPSSPPPSPATRAAATKAAPRGAPSSKPATPAAARRNPSLERDAVLNPFE